MAESTASSGSNERSQPRRRSSGAAPYVSLLTILVVASGIAWAGSQGGATFGGYPALWWCAVFAFLIQWVIFVPSYLARTEHYFDLAGAATNISVPIIALVLTGSYDLRSILLVAAVSVWALRLGVFLFRRVRASGKDGRFDKIKQSFPDFLVAWTLQGLWVLATLCAALAAITAGSNVPLGALDIVGLALFVLGLTVEAVADTQKTNFKREPQNRDRFINVGLWSWSRHPNYFGEILLWTGIAISATSTFAGWRWAMLISPLFVFVLLTQISGIPLLERRAKKKWGDDPDFKRYMATTSRLLPLPPRSN